MGVTKLDEKRAPCEYCGEPPHKTELMCPRIKRITYHEDGDVTVSFTETPIVLAYPNNPAN
jgi:hypothetical protein